MFEEDDIDDGDLYIKLPMDINPSRIKIGAAQKDGNFVVTVNVSGPFTDEEQEVIDGLIEAIEEEDGKDKKYMRSLN